MKPLGKQFGMLVNEISERQLRTLLGDGKVIIKEGKL